MIQALFRAVLTDAVSCLHEPSVFASTKQEREHRVRTVLGINYPATLVQYLSTVDAERWAKDLIAVLPVVARRESRLLPTVRGSTSASHGLRFTLPPGFTELGFSSEMVSDLEAVLNAALPEEQSASPNSFVEAVQQACVMELSEQLLGSTAEQAPASVLDRWMADIRSQGTEQTVLRAIQHWIATDREVPAPLVQSPLPMDGAVRSAIRAALAAKYPGSVTCFEVERSLAGGIRVFVGGVMHDASWISQAEHSLEQLHVLS